VDNQGEVRVAGGRRIALGLADYLEAFASRVSAETWQEFAATDPLNWRFAFLEIADDPETIMFFNLHQIDVWLGLTRASTGRATPTDWELFQVQQHEIWWPRIEWWDNEARAPNPFERADEP
jgi:hypothetical protein